MFPASGQMSCWYAIKAVIVRSYLRLPGHRGQPFFFFFRAAEAASAIDRLARQSLFRRKSAWHSIMKRSDTHTLFARWLTISTSELRINKQFPVLSFSSQTQRANTIAECFTLCQRRVVFWTVGGRCGNFQMPPKKLTADKDQQRLSSFFCQQHVAVVCDPRSELYKQIAGFHETDFPNILKLVKCAVTLPVHTADVERNFSTQNLIWTGLRNTLTTEHQDMLMRVHLEGPKNAQELNQWVVKVVERWYKDRKLLKKSASVPSASSKWSLIKCQCGDFLLCLSQVICFLFLFVCLFVLICVVLFWSW